MVGLRAALATPLTGPLAGYGSAGATALGLWAEGAGASLSVHDAHPDPLAALRDAEAERPDLLFGPYGSGPAAVMASAASRLLWNHGGARVPSAPLLVSVLAPAATYWGGALRAIAAADPAIATVAVLSGPTGFGGAVGGGAAMEAGSLGLAATLRPLPVPVPPGRDLAGAEVVLVAGGFGEEQEAAAALLPGPWRAAGFVGAGVDEVLAFLGQRRDGLLGPAQWLASAAPEPDEGPAAPEFVRAYRHAAGADPAYPAAQAFAAGLIAARCVKDAGSTAAADLLAAAAALDCTTMFDRFRLDPVTGRQVGHRMLTVQWQHGRRRVIWPPDRAQARLRLAPGPGGQRRAPGGRRDSPARRPGRPGPE